jgi:hypothetical protein
MEDRLGSRNIFEASLTDSITGGDAEYDIFTGAGQHGAAAAPVVETH